MKNPSQFEIAVLKTKYLRSEYKYCFDIFERARILLDQEVLNLHSDLNIYDSEFDNPYKPEAEPANSSKDFNVDARGKEDDIREVSKHTESIPAWAKKLYRKIVMISHPDKLKKDISIAEADSLLETYERAVEAYGSSDYSELVNIAINLEVAIEDQGPEVTTIIQKECDALERKIVEIKSSSYWIWFHSDTETQESMLAEFIKQRGWGSRESMRTRSRKGPGSHPGKSLKWVREKCKI
jgi:hypothetical protein